MIKVYTNQPVVLPYLTGELVEIPVLGAKNGLKLYDMIGLDYKDEKWETLLDQMTFDEMVKSETTVWKPELPASTVPATICQSALWRPQF